MWLHVNDGTLQYHTGVIRCSKGLTRESLCVSFYLKAKNFPNSSSCRILNNFNNVYLNRPRSSKPLGFKISLILEGSDLNDLQIYKCQNFRFPPWKVPDIKVCEFCYKKTSYSCVGGYALFNNHLFVHSNTLFIFTDGPKSDLGVACAAVIGNIEYSSKLHNMISNYSTELMAILLVIKNIFYRQDFNNFYNFYRLQKYCKCFANVLS